MKNILIILALVILTSCKNDDDNVNNCNFLLNVNVSATLNLNLPEYSQLMFSTNSVYVPNQGNAGIYVTNIGNDNFRAWDASDPNHAPNGCSLLALDGIKVICGCPDENEYDLLTGQAFGEELPCGLREYRVTLSGSNLIVSN
ncbi:hypothetical protein [uncultured Psychroserpens sp.]|uniref:Rieske (2Fe-2S) protein n=1 Tax=uncultured Psychroserpens sp. TaxID=255436 RepID=UPI00262503AC|nr:hypothetical protein [uncultured Psychroserpens sp.]